ncbi:MAG: class I SAM-dependent methyltransferase [Gammaproteobacteria bacterium]|nr:class I SAM-dependent methyltransferase [Gammaproteobacteria bacterium]MCP4090670.1 class I SAM-dependent methyltransferase [Gammaproteobacteria bacterium]MCP4276978.1 class I SAM-dependent methyltransferase [Gammaproteobacteria bacterium]MCP4831750.1 class I SAM-dependent methyltransferase [Gammaproteobacteria bacterium]MCP4930231.1 class I SAM-dependent methyltransferase [Gammaproteobacteria bacterium]
MSVNRIPGSFRDPSGFLYLSEETLLRQVNQSYAAHFDHLVSSGLYEQLVTEGLLIEHQVVDNSLRATDDVYCVLKPELIPHLSYPYEWSFSQLKDAALLTLDVQRQALEKGMTLKDASAYNVQFLRGRPVFIDSLSFEINEEGAPWIAYRQFCQHFLAPLAIMANVDISLNQLFRTNIDGIPLHIATSMLPWRTKLNPGLYMHIWLHVRSQVAATQSQRSSEQSASNKPSKQFSQNAFYGLIDSLRGAIQKLEWKPGGSEWFDYYQANNNYGEDGLEYKENLVKQFVSKAKPSSVWDLGGNTGHFSRLAAAEGASVVCWDIDPGCVESNYRQVSQEQETNILPLLIDLSNPSPSIGWANSERLSISERGPVEMIMALGLIHHLAIANNVPLPDVSEFLKKNCKWLLIEFVPRGDGQIDKLLSSRQDVFSEYTPEGFEKAFSQDFEIVDKVPVPATKRTLYLMQAF